jgi:hypothetical protein
VNLLKSIMRPARLREKQAEQRRAQVSEEGGSVEVIPGAVTASMVEDAMAVKEMLRSKGWQVIQQRLVRHNARLWLDFVNPSVLGTRAETLRLQAMKYSGIESVIDEILQQGEAVQRSNV